MKLWKYLKEKMMENPTRTLREREAIMSFEKMCIFAESYSGRLTDTHYGILCTSELATLMALLGCIAAERPAILIPTEYGKDICYEVLDRFDPPYIIHDLRGMLCELYMEPQRKFRLADSDTAAVILRAAGGKIAKETVLPSRKIVDTLECMSAPKGRMPSEHAPLSSSFTSPSALYELFAALCEGKNIVFSHSVNKNLFF